jgi:hypothetical protein
MSAPAVAIVPAPTRKRLIQVAALAWLAFLGVDVLMNAGLLGPFLNWEQPGLLPPMKMFRYIPLGYAAFLLLTILVLWLMLQLNVRGARAGAIFGAKFGGLMAAAGFLGEMSIYTFPKRMLFCFALDKLVYCVVLGAVIGSGLAAERLRSLTKRVIALFFLCVVVAVVMQNLGLVPARTFKGERVGIGWNPKK